MTISITTLTIGSIAGAGLCCTIFTLINRAREISRREIADFNEKKVGEQAQQIENLQQKVVQFASEKSRLEAEKSGLEEKLKNQQQETLQLNEARRKEIAELNEARKLEVAELQKTSQLQFQNLANQILEEKSSKFTESNKTNIEALLKPLGENINSFKKKVEETYEKESRQKLSLEEQIKNLSQQSNKISAEANNLASALKGQTKRQGNWGEMILETILQNSGLLKDIHYRREENFRNEDGKNFRPDFIITLPDSKLVVVDSKTSLIAYEKFCSAENEALQNLAMKEHLDSIYKHIDELSAKKYDDLDGALDFTFMFIPVEPAYLAAIQADANLWSYAYKKRILLISPTNLIACLKLISELWRREDQNKNRDEILRQAGNLHDKFVGFVESLERVGKQIGSAQEAYETAIGQLREGKDNLIAKVEKLKELGVKTHKSLTNNKKISPKLLPSEMTSEIMVEEASDEE